MTLKIKAFAVRMAIPAFAGMTLARWGKRRGRDCVWV